MTNRALLTEQHERHLLNICLATVSVRFKVAANDERDDDDDERTREREIRRVAVRDIFYSFFFFFFFCFSPESVCPRTRPLLPRSAVVMMMMMVVVVT